jgi:chromosome partitioning protein
MKVIVCASGKGGSGKTLTTATLAIRLARQKKGDKGEGKVAMIDLNADQASLTQWWILRGRGVAPFLLENPGNVIHDVKTLAADNYSWCLIDTPPTDTEVIEFAIMTADLVVVPVRASFLDMNAIDLIVDLCKKRRRPYAFLFNSYDARPQFKKVNAEALAMLKGKGGRIFEAKLPYDAAFMSGQSAGKTGPEVKADLGKNVDGLIGEIKDMLAERAV